ncbi:MAG: hypothetical protein C5B57_07275, partial [Blastocatellia bacterium]
MVARHTLMLLTFAAALLAAGLICAQEPDSTQRGGGAVRGQLAAPRNLQVLAEDTPQPQVLQTMQQFAAALGVQCGYCHVQDTPTDFDFHSDDKPQKKVAREMMLMVREINAKVVAAVGQSESKTTRTLCVTCHRGVAIPRQLVDILDRTTVETGMASAIAQYRDLRKQYFGGQAYDFSEGSLVA